MIIDFPDILRTWVANTLSPICDADPAALAKYVMALLKKDKAENELKDFCADQLEVFLQKETAGFVDQLFVVIRDKSYLNQQPAPPMCTAKVEPTETPPPATAVTSLTPSMVAPSVDDFGSSSYDSTLVPGANSGQNNGESLASAALTPGSLAAATSDRRRVSRDRHRTSKRGASPTSDQLSHKNFPSSPSSHRSRSRDQGSKRDRQSPPVTSSSSLRAGYGQIPPRDKDKENRETRHRQHSPTLMSSSSRGARKRSISRGEKNWREKSPPRMSSPQQKQRRPHVDSLTHEAPDRSLSPEKSHKRKRQRCRDYDEKGYCMRGDSCIFDHGPDPVVVEEVSLPRIIMKGPPPCPHPPVDFSQPPPGYVMHPPPPGVDPAFSSSAITSTAAAATSASAGGVALSSVTSTEPYNPETPSLSSTAVPPPPAIHAASTVYGQATLGAGPVAVWNQGIPPPPFTAQYPSTGIKPPSVDPYRSRELVTLAEGQQMAAASLGSTQGLYTPMVGGRFVSMGVRPYQPHQVQPQNAPFDRTNKTLEVRRIPTHQNTIAKLNEHFSQFGAVTNIQIRYQGDPEAALVSFSARHQAISAYKSTMPILNNRFIRMFWHNAKDDEEDGAALGVAGHQPIIPSIRDRLGPAPVDPLVQIDDTSMKARRGMETVDDDARRAVLFSSSGNLTKTLYNPVALKNAVASIRQKSVEREQVLHTKFHPSVKASTEALDIATAQTKHGVHKKQLELQKAKMELYKKQIEQQKVLLHQLAKCKDQNQRKEISKTIKQMETHIAKLKGQLTEVKVTPLPLNAKKSKEQVERQLLDAELEMINQRQQGADTSNLHERLAELRRQVLLLKDCGLADSSATSARVVKAMSAPPTRRRMSSHRPVPAYATLDKRPRELLVAGEALSGDPDKDTSLIEHFESFGVLEDWEYMPKQQTDTKEHQKRVLVAFKLRKDAEMAMASGKEFKDSLLDIQWFNRPSKLPSEKENPKSELTAQDLLATLGDDDDDEEASSDDNQQADIDEDIPEIERGWKR